MKSARLITVTVFSSIFFMSCNTSINRSIQISDGEMRRGSVNSINGRIRIGKDCNIRGACRSINGHISIGEKSKVRDVQVVNGNIDLDEDVCVRDDVQSVNGSVECKAGVVVDGKIQTINGEVDLNSTLVRRDITTYNGNIYVENNSVVKGDIVIKGKRGKSPRKRILKIYIGGDSVVEGNIYVRDDRCKVKVILSNGGRVEGKVKNAEVVSSE